MKHIRLEYSFKLGQFNRAAATDIQDVENGFETVCCLVDSYRATSFIEAMQVKHPSLKCQGNSHFLTISEVRHELLQFIEEDIKLLDQHMTNTFQRRQAILKNNS